MPLRQRGGRHFHGFAPRKCCRHPPGFLKLSERRQRPALKQAQASFVTCNPQSRNKSQIQIKMSQIATAVIPEAAAVVIGTENANPNAESVAVLKAKDTEHAVCTENLRSESSTPVKEIVEAQIVATSQPSGNCLKINFCEYQHCRSAKQMHSNFPTHFLDLHFTQNVFAKCFFIEIFLIFNLTRLLSRCRSAGAARKRRSACCGCGGRDCCRR